MPRQEFLSAMQAKLTEFDDKLARLASASAPRSERARLEREKTHCFLKASRAELSERLKQALHTPDESWHEFKASMQRIYDGMARRLEEP